MVRVLSGGRGTELDCWACRSCMALIHLPRRRARVRRRLRAGDVEKAGLVVVRCGGPGRVGGRRRGWRRVTPNARCRLEASSGRRAMRSTRGAMAGFRDGARWSASTGARRLGGTIGRGGGKGAGATSPKAWRRSREKWVYSGGKPLGRGAKEAREVSRARRAGSSRVEVGGGALQQGACSEGSWEEGKHYTWI